MVQDGTKITERQLIPILARYWLHRALREVLQIGTYGGNGWEVRVM